MSSFSLTDLSKAASPDGPPLTGYFFAVRLADGQVGRAGVRAETYLEARDDSRWRERVLARLNEMEDSGWELDDIAAVLVERGLIVVGIDPGLILHGRTVDPAERGPFPRPLSDIEKGVARRVLELDGVAELDVLLEQLEAAAAASPCECPCPSVEIEVDHARAKPIARGCVEADAVWDRGGIMVSAVDGWLSSLEIWWWIGDSPTVFPALTDIRPFEGTRD